MQSAQPRCREWISRACGDGCGKSSLIRWGREQGQRGKCLEISLCGADADHQPEGDNPSQSRRRRPGTRGHIAAVGTKADHGFSSALGPPSGGNLIGLVHQCALRLTRPWRKTCPMCASPASALAGLGCPPGPRRWRLKRLCEVVIGHGHPPVGELHDADEMHRPFAVFDDPLADPNLGATRTLRQVILGGPGTSWYMAIKFARPTKRSPDWGRLSMAPSATKGSTVSRSQRSQAANILCAASWSVSEWLFPLS
jgi:hypothetical protein